MRNTSTATTETVPAVANKLWAGLLVHALPLLGVYFLGWSLFSVMAIYLFEAAIIVGFGIARFVWHGPKAKSQLPTLLFLSILWFAPAVGFMIGATIGVVNYFYIPGEVLYGDTFPTWGELANRVLVEWLWVPVLFIFFHQLHAYVDGWIRSGAYRHSEGMLGIWQAYGTMFLTVAVLLVTAAVVLDSGLGSAAVAVVVMVRIVLDLGNHILLPRLVKRR